MGGGGHSGHGAEYPGYPTAVWSPTGGWFPDPKYWRRNTVIAAVGIFLVCIPIARLSMRLEERPVSPAFPLPYQSFSKRKASEES